VYGGGGLWWPEPMIEVTYMHVWAHVEQYGGRRRSVIRFCELYFFILKSIIVTDLANVSRPVATVT
jgi:hypothetical protein